MIRSFLAAAALAAAVVPAQAEMPETINFGVIATEFHLGSGRILRAVFRGYEQIARR